MLLALVFGVILGAVSIIFAMQNTAPTTVSFLDWQFSAPIALMLLLAVVSGVIITLLSMVPKAVRDSYEAYAERRAERRAAAQAARETPTTEPSVIL